MQDIFLREILTSDFHLIIHSYLRPCSKHWWYDSAINSFKKILTLMEFIFCKEERDNVIKIITNVTTMWEAE